MSDYDSGKPLREIWDDVGRAMLNYEAGLVKPNDLLLAIQTLWAVALKRLAARQE